MARRRLDLVETFGGPWRLAGATAAMLILVLATLVALVWLGEDQKRFPDLRASVALPLLLLVGLGSLLLLLALLVAVLNSFGLTDKRHAFGLPDGSVQAVIALALILIFIIASLFLYSSLPDGRIKAVDPNAVQNKRELAQQLLTTVGTLAVAVAGFYFGTRSVETAAAATRRVGAATLRLVWPSSPAYLDMKPSTTLEPIIVETDPEDRRIKVEVTGDEPTTVEETQPGTFRYKRGPSPTSEVVLAFSLMDGTEKNELQVLDAATKPKPTP
jgi:hypothetical protein